jgi:hypothetical protein
MGLFKITQSEAEWVCPCGEKQSVSLDDLEADLLTVVLPICSKCNKTKLVLCCVDGSLDHLEESSKKRYAIIQSLHKRLVQMGRFKDGISANDIPIGIHTYAMDDSVIEAPLHSRIRAAMEAKEKAKKK